MTNIEPMFDYLVVNKDEQVEKTSGGLYLTDNTKEKPSSGIVEKVGPGYYTDNGTFVVPTVSVGDRVLFPRLVGQTVEYNGEDVFLVKEREIIGIIR